MKIMSLIRVLLVGICSTYILYGCNAGVGGGTPSALIASKSTQNVVNNSLSSKLGLKTNAQGLDGSAITAMTSDTLGNVYAGTATGDVYVLESTSSTWSQEGTAPLNGNSSVTNIATSVSNGNVSIYATTANNALFSFNGSSWTKATYSVSAMTTDSNGNIYALSVAVGNTISILELPVGTSSWILFSSPVTSPFTGSVNSITFNPTNSNIYLVTSEGNVWKYEGQNIWNDESSLNKIQVTSLVYFNNMISYVVGNEMGKISLVCKQWKPPHPPFLMPSCTKWANVFNPYTSVPDGSNIVATVSNASSNLYVATADGNVYSEAAGGGNWTLIGTSGNPSISITSLTFSNGNVYAGLSNGTVEPWNPSCQYVESSVVNNSITESAPGCYSVLVPSSPNGTINITAIGGGGGGGGGGAGAGWGSSHHSQAGAAGGNGTSGVNFTGSWTPQNLLAGTPLYFIVGGGGGGGAGANAGSAGNGNGVGGSGGSGGGGSAVWYGTNTVPSYFVIANGGAGGGGGGGGGYGNWVVNGGAGGSGGSGGNTLNLSNDLDPMLINGGAGSTSSIGMVSESSYNVALLIGGIGASNNLNYQGGAGGGAGGSVAYVTDPNFNGFGGGGGGSGGSMNGAGAMPTDSTILGDNGNSGNSGEGCYLGSCGYNGAGGGGGGTGGYYWYLYQNNASESASAATIGSGAIGAGGNGGAAGGPGQNSGPGGAGMNGSVTISFN